MRSQRRPSSPRHSSFSLVWSACRKDSVTRTLIHRPIRIGVVNLMPFAEDHEPRFNEMISIKLDTRAYRTCDRDHIRRHYHRFEDVAPLDGLVVTGAAVDTVPLSHVAFWPELATILKAANDGGTLVLGLCWGAIAVGATLGVPAVRYERKLFGVFETRLLAKGSAWKAAKSDTFWCPHSRYAGLDPIAVAAGVATGRLELIAHAAEAGDVIVATPDHRRMMHLGHPEYTAQRLVDEYERDRAAGRTNAQPPRHVDLRNPQEPWLAHRRAFFGGWLADVAALARSRECETPAVCFQSK